MNRRLEHLPHFGLPIGSVFCALLLLGAAPGSAQAKGKKRHQHKYIGGHPLSQKTGDGYCFIEVPHVHKNGPPARHRVLYRDHHGQSHFVADPSPYGYEGDRHSYYGHHPIAVEVIVGGAPRYEAGQEIEYCYLDGPHYHGFSPQPGLSFEAKGGVSWYVGELPAAYVEGKGRYKRGNRVYATIEVERPVVEIEAPPAGYVGPVLDVHVHGHLGNRGRTRGHVDVGVHVEAPSVEIGFGLPGLVVDDHRHHHKHKRHRKHRKHKRHRKHKKHRKHRKHRKRPHRR